MADTLEIKILVLAVVEGIKRQPGTVLSCPKIKAKALIDAEYAELATRKTKASVDAG